MCSNRIGQINSDSAQHEAGPMVRDRTQQQWWAVALTAVARCVQSVSYALIDRPTEMDPPLWIGRSHLASVMDTITIVAFCSIKQIAASQWRVFGSLGRSAIGNGEAATALLLDNMESAACADQ